MLVYQGKVYAIFRPYGRCVCGHETWIGVRTPFARGTLLGTDLFFELEAIPLEGHEQVGILVCPD